MPSSILPDGGDATEQQAAQFHLFTLRQSVQHLILNGVDFGMAGGDHRLSLAGQRGDKDSTVRRVGLPTDQP
jgi:hypothetical protein